MDNGNWEYVKMPFGLKNAPAIFQRLMNSVLKDLIGRVCLIYVVDIIIFGKGQERTENLSSVFKQLKEANLNIQLDKSESLQKETKFLGHVVSSEGIHRRSILYRILLYQALPSKYNHGLESQGIIVSLLITTLRSLNP